MSSKFLGIARIPSVSSCNFVIHAKLVLIKRLQSRRSRATHGHRASVYPPVEISAPIIATKVSGTSHHNMMSNGLAAPGGLHSKAQDELLNMIDSLRFEGLDKDLSLPQLVVCGDQSSGKSSVLEAIAEIPFPRKENLCTRCVFSMARPLETTNGLQICHRNRSAP